ncbi:spondin domain-containing protein [Photobacterium andalusiense]|uniref:Spondin_N n=1 Tax=Photobacterium andalusiense TaxID=2204296 RepID=A0A1Y6MGB7_9GAMM|nr:spondin domain-containing protein [Photobacterium andalusiense]SMY34251.1 hypothetical protein PAND9192_01236 [Photobacterium andalusiense]
MKRHIYLLTSVIAVAAIAGCNHNENKMASIAMPTTGLTAGAQFDVSVTNNSASQPLSPLALISSSQQEQVFALGKAASVELEHLAEGGNNTPLLDYNRHDSSVDIANTGIGVIPPGKTETVRITVNDPKAMYLTVASMLVNTNDAFIAEEINLSTIPVMKEKVITAPTWDAGTELNTETANSIPGPAAVAAGGTAEGFNAERNDIINKVTTHRGVISNQEGLVTSVLTGENKFLNPSVKITITRIQ